MLFSLYFTFLYLYSHYRFTADTEPCYESLFIHGVILLTYFVA